MNFRPFLLLVLLFPAVAYPQAGTQVYITPSQFDIVTTKLDAGVVATLQASTNMQLSASHLQTLINNLSGSLTGQAAALDSAASSLAGVNAAMNAPLWSTIGNNLVGLNANLSGVRADLVGGLGGITNVLGSLPADLQNMINIVLNGVMAANSNLASSTNLANLAGLAALTNLMGVIALTNITDQLSQVNSNLLAMTNFGIDPGGLQAMADDIGQSLTNTSLIAMNANSNYLASLKDSLKPPMESNLNATVNLATNQLESLNVLKASTNWLDKIWTILGVKKDIAVEGTNYLKGLKDQGDAAAVKREELKDKLTELVAIQRTNVPVQNVIVTNSHPGWQPGSQDLIDGSLVGRSLVLTERDGMNTAAHQSAGDAVAGLFGFASTVPTRSVTRLGTEPSMIVTFPRYGGGAWVFDLNPMHNTAIAPLVGAFRTAIAWAATVAFLVFCGKRARESAAAAVATPQIALPNVMVLGNNLGLAAAPVFVGVYIAAAAIFCAAVAAVVQPGTLSGALGLDPLSGFSGGVLWLSDQMLPIALLVAQALWMLTATYTLMAASWVFTTAKTLLVR